jgi:putative flippase GtrA
MTFPVSPRLNVQTKDLRRVVRFGMVGVIATVVHWLVTVSVTELFQMNPLVANAVGWGTAVAVSFVGHWTVTFRGHESSLLRSGLRFLGVSTLGFAANSLIYGALLAINPLLYPFWLSMTLALVAVMTCLLSNLWVFRRG